METTNRSRGWSALRRSSNLFSDSSFFAFFAISETLPVRRSKTALVALFLHGLDHLPLLPRGHRPLPSSARVCDCRDCRKALTHDTTHRLPGQSGFSSAKVRPRSERLWLPGGTAVSTVSRQRLAYNAG